MIVLLFVDFVRLLIDMRFMADIHKLFWQFLFNILRACIMCITIVSGEGLQSLF